MVRDSLQLLAGTFFSNLFNLIRVWIIAKTLVPETYGLWNLFTVILSYCLILDFGLVSGMDKRVPFLRGQSRMEEIDHVKNVAFSGLHLVSLILSAGLLLISFIPYPSWSDETIVGLRLLSLVTFFAVLQNFHLTVMRAEKKFGVISATLTIHGVAAVGFLVIAYQTPLNKFYGTLLSLFLAYLTSLSVCLLLSRQKFKFTLNMATLVSLSRTGFPLVMLGLGFVLFMSMDRWLIARYLNQTDLGHYALGITIANLLFMLASVFAYIFYPRVLERFGENQHIPSIRPYVLRIMTIISYLTAALCCLMIMVLPFLYQQFFAAYLPGMNSAYLLILGMFFVAFATIPGNFLVAVNQQNVILLAQAAGIVLSVTGNYIAIKLTGDIFGVAVMSALLFSAYGLVIIIYSLKLMGQTFVEVTRTLIGLVLPLMLGLSVLLFFSLAQKWIGNLPDHLVIPLEGASLVMILTMLFFVQHRGTGILSEMKDALWVNKKIPN